MEESLHVIPKVISNLIMQMFQIYLVFVYLAIAVINSVPARYRIKFDTLTSFEFANRCNVH